MPVIGIRLPSLSTATPPARQEVARDLKVLQVAPLKDVRP